MLQLLDIHKNELDGSLPSDIRKNTAMEFLSFFENEITGMYHLAVIIAAFFTQ